MDGSIGELESIEALKLPGLRYGGTFKIINTYFGDKKRYLQAIKEWSKSYLQQLNERKMRQLHHCKRNSNITQADCLHEC